MLQRIWAEKQQILTIRPVRSPVQAGHCRKICNLRVGKLQIRQDLFGDNALPPRGVAT